MAFSPEGRFTAIVIASQTFLRLELEELEGLAA
jgi:hypothetical protein